MAKAKKEETFIPDIPAQMEEVESIEVVKEVVAAIEEVVETDEVSFLKRILLIQHNGGWGRHLDGVINERIDALKSK